jgi:D-sedoheptulose 7-phosphate isomerase
MIMDFEKQIQESIETKNKLILKIADIKQIGKILAAKMQDDKKILIAGNGGSAADAQHMAGELVGRFKKERKGLPCIALTTDTSIITAWTNDYCYDSLFERQIESLGREGDVFIGISTSGNSRNIIKAVEKAKKQGMTTVLMLGNDGGKLKEMGDYSIVVPSDDTPRIQESHILLVHLWCDYIEQALFGDGVE